jgi:hypothetical protein
VIPSVNQLVSFVEKSEIYRKNFSELLREALSVGDERANKIFELEQNKTLTNISYNLLQVKLNMLYESINAISNAKNLEDKYQYEISQ